MFVSILEECRLQQRLEIAQSASYFQREIIRRSDCKSHTLTEVTEQNMVENSIIINA